MRAFMSDATARAAWERDRILRGWPGDDERATVREARAILAETTPPDSWTAGRPGRGTIPLDALSARQNPAARAMADAIPAFLVTLDGLIADGAK